MKLNKEVKERIYYAILNTLNLKTRDYFVNKVQEELDKVQDQGYVKAYKQVSELCKQYRIRFYSGVSISHRYDFCSQSDIFCYRTDTDLALFKEVCEKVNLEYMEQKKVLDQIKEYVFIPNTVKQFKDLYPDWVKFLNKCMPEINAPKKKLPSVPVDLSFMKGYMKDEGDS